MEGAARLEPGRPACGVQLLSRGPVEPALADDARRVESAAADVRGVRRHRAPLVVRRAACGVRVERGRATRRSGSSMCRAASERRFVPERRAYRSPVGRLRLRVTDARGPPVPARVSVTGPDGRSWAPDDAWRHADDGFDRSERRFEYGYFHTRGTDSLTLPAGEYAVEVTAGPRPGSSGARLPSAPATTRAPPLPCAARRPRPSRLVQRRPARAHELRRRLPQHAAPARVPGAGGGLDLVENLIVNKEGRIPDIDTRRSAATRCPRRDRDRARPGVPHQRLGPYRPARASAITSCCRGTRATPHRGRQPRPTNAEVADLARAQGALVGYVHPFDSDPDPADTTHPLTAEFPVDLALGKVDYYEALGFVDDPMATAHVWYRRAQLRFPPAGGRGHGRDGQLRLAAWTGGHESSLCAHRRAARPAAAARLAQGRPHVCDQWPAARAHDRRPRRGRRGPARRGDLRGRGARVAPVERADRSPRDSWAMARSCGRCRSAGDRTRADAEVRLPVTGSGWFLLRARSDRAIEPVLDLYPYATTSPIYLTVGGKPTRSAKDAAYFIAWIDRVAAAARANTDWNSAEERVHALGLIGQARQEFERRR